MRLLIDTQAILWFQGSDDKLSDTAKNLISDKENACFISIVSLWEIAIKVKSNKLNVGMPFHELQSYLLSNDFQILNLDFLHLVKLSDLDDHHKDPFDRILIAQSIVENLPLVSIDRHFSSYPVNLIW